MKPITIKLTDLLDSRIQSAAVEMEVNRSEFIRQAIEEKLEQDPKRIAAQRVAPAVRDGVVTPIDSVPAKRARARRVYRDETAESPLEAPRALCRHDHRVRGPNGRIACKDCPATLVNGRWQIVR